MSMKPQAIPDIPAETVRVVRAVFPKGNIYIHLCDTLGAIYQDELFADLYPDRGQPAYARLSLCAGHRPSGTTPWPSPPMGSHNCGPAAEARTVRGQLGTTGTMNCGGRPWPAPDPP